MRRSMVVAIAAIIAAFALTGLPVPAGSHPRPTRPCRRPSPQCPSRRPPRLPRPRLSVVDLRSAGHVRPTRPSWSQAGARRPDLAAARRPAADRRPGRPGSRPSRSSPGTRRSTTTAPRRCACRAGRSSGSAATAAASCAPSPTTARRSGAGSSTCTARTSSGSAAARRGRAPGSRSRSTAAGAPWPGDGGRRAVALDWARFPRRSREAGWPREAGKEDLTPCDVARRSPRR